MNRDTRRFGCALASASVAALAAFLFYDRYFRWRGEFSTEGRAYDPVDGTVFLEQAGLIWGGCFGFFALAAIVAFFAGWRIRRARSRGEESWDERARRPIFGEDDRP